MLNISSSAMYLSLLAPGSFTTTFTASVRASKSVTSPGSITMMSPGPYSTPFIRTRPYTITVSSVAILW